QIRVREPMALEDRVAEYLVQVGRKPDVLFRGEVLQIKLEDLSQPDEQGRRERAAVVLNEVEVARRDAQALRQVDLRHVLAPTKCAHLGPEKQCFRHLALPERLLRT